MNKPSKTYRPLSRFLRYWILFLLGVLLPMGIGIPWLDAAVAQVSLFAVALVAIQYSVYTKPLKSGMLSILRGGITAVAFAVVTILTMVSLYVLRHGTSIPQTDNWIQTLAGISYVVLVHLTCATFVSRRWPATNPDVHDVRAKQA